MIKALILSFHYLPANNMATNRTLAYARHLHKHGIRPTIVTHDFESKGSNKAVIKKFETHTEIYFPLNSHWLSDMHTAWHGQKYLNRMAIFLHWMFGFLDGDPRLLMSYFSLKKALKNHLKNHTYDLIVGIYSPHHMLKLAAYLSRETKTPLALDFRDVWSLRILQNDYKPSRSEELHDKLCAYHWKKWLKQSLFLSIVSADLYQIVYNLSGTKGEVVTNGFESEHYAQKKPQRNHLFTLVFAGTMYQIQKIELLLQAISRLRKASDKWKIKLVFLGSKRNNYNRKLSQFSFKELEPIIRSFNLQDICELTERVKIEEARRIQQESDLLVFPTFSGLTGVQSGKIFEYLGARRPILCFPRDHSVIDELMQETKAGVVLDSVNEIEDYLKKCYTEWEQNGFLGYDGIEEQVTQYSRESQVSKFAELVKQKISVSTKN
jgi:glycosyltransferase involved in cell wall biosynthesis